MSNLNFNKELNRGRSAAENMKSKRLDLLLNDVSPQRLNQIAFFISLRPTSPVFDNTFSFTQFLERGGEIKKGPLLLLTLHSFR